jgi:circadian clock protein KaiC
VTSMGLQHQAATERVPTGLEFLDGMLDGRGYYRGSTVLLSGGAGTGKTSFAAKFVEAACARGERALYFLFEESPEQLIRNVRSIGIDLRPWADRGLLKFHADRPSRFGLEAHLAAMYSMVRDFKPSAVVVDPVTNLITVGTSGDVRAMLTRIIDALKTQEITALFTSLAEGVTAEDSAVSSLMDTWVVLRMTQRAAERRRVVTVIKSRGMAHSNRDEEFVLTDRGVSLVRTHDAALSAEVGA